MKEVGLIKMCFSETYSTLHIGKNLTSFLFRMALKKGETLSPLLFNFALEYAIRRVQEKQDRLKLNGTPGFHLC
jgi:hypothetical protein